MDVRVVNLKKGPFGQVLAFFDFVIDGALVVRGNALKQKQDGKYFYMPKGIQRFNKDKTPAKNDAGYDIYDAVCDLYTEKDGDTYKPTQAAWDVRKDILDQAVAIYEGGSGGNAGRGSSKKVATKVTAGAKKSKTDEVEQLDDVDLEDGDDGLPF